MMGLKWVIASLTGLVLSSGFLYAADEYGRTTGDPVVSGAVPGTLILPAKPIEPAPVDETVRESSTVESPSPAPSFTLPARGTSMTDVERQLGKPTRSVAAVGTPPITRWEYANFTIYFEHSRVLHAVSNEKKRKTP